MSIYISGVEMPKEHPLYITLRPDGSVHVWDSYSGEGYGTQAISVPEHGKLIDADAAIANRNTDMNWCYDLYDLPDYLADCPTIISADPPVMYYPQVPGITPIVISDKEKTK